MSVDQQEIKKFLQAFEFARDLYTKEDNWDFNQDTWNDAQATVLEAGGYGQDRTYVNFAVVSYLLIIALSNRYEVCKPMPWVLDVLPHLLVQLKLEESND